MSYIEDAIDSYIKRILTSGIVVLTNKRFIFYSGVAIILPLLLTVYSFIKGGSEITTTYEVLFNLELGACLSLIITGILSMKMQILKVERIVFIILTLLIFAFNMAASQEIRNVENVVIYASFYSWILTTNISALIAIRDFVVSWPGWLLRLGDEEGRIMFSPFIKTGLFASIAYFIYVLWTNFSWGILLAFFAGALVFYTIYIIIPLTKDSILASIISIFYIVILYHIFVRSEGSTGFLLFDTIIIIATMIFTAQGLSNLLSSKKYAIPRQWDSFIIILLGMMLGYHLLTIKIITVGGLNFLYSLYHNMSFGFGTIIMFLIIILYASTKKFRFFSQNQITPQRIFEEVSTIGLEKVNEYASKLKQTIKKKQWSFEIKKRKGENENDEEENPLGLFGIRKEEQK